MEQQADWLQRCLMENIDLRPKDVPSLHSVWGGDSLLDHVDVAIYAVDALGRCVRLNAAAERLLGYAEAEALGHNMHTLVHSRHPDGSPYPAEDCPLMQARTANRVVQGIGEMLWAKNGEPLSVVCSASPVDLGGGATGAVITIKDMRDREAAEELLKASAREQAEALRQRDATARVERELAAAESIRQRDLSLRVEKAATDQLREQQELLATVAETAPVGIAVLDSALRYRWYNRTYRLFLEACGQAETEAQSSGPTSALIHDEAEILQVIRKVRDSGQSHQDDELALSDADNNHSYWRWSVSRLATNDVMVVATDVTEQVDARREVETIYATAPIALALVDAKDFHYLRANEQQAEILGVPQQELLGKRLSEVVGIPEVQQIFEQVAAGEAVYHRVVSGSLPGRPGEVRHWTMNLMPNLNASGEVETISVAGSEITAQKRAEEALMQADKLAAVGRLAASISHEINNPLEAVTNLLYLVHNDPNLSEEASAYVTMAEGELARVSQIASQTLRFHRHAIGVVALKPQQVVEPVVALYQGRLKNSHVKLRTEYRDDAPVVCLEGDVRQILNNLIGNAIDAIGDGGTIVVRTRKARSARTGRDGTRISVSDSGHGMKLETAAHIFEPFFTTKGASGSGLGLWISHTLAERQGGVLQVRSCTDELRTATRETGTTFSLFLPDADPVDASARVM